MFMTMVCSTYIVYAPEGLGSVLIPLMGNGGAYICAIIVGAALTLSLTFMFMRYKRALKTA